MSSSNTSMTLVDSYEVLKNFCNSLAGPDVLVDAYILQMFAQWIRSLPAHDVHAVACDIIPIEQLPVTWNPLELYPTVLRACLLVFLYTNRRIVPREFQLHASLAAHLGRDSVIIAGTGSGKTLCIAIPVLLNPSKISIVISPLKRLQVTQADYFNRLGIRTAAINEDTHYGPTMWQDIAEGSIPILIVQVEQLRHQEHTPRIASLLRQTSFQQIIGRIHVDEAHHIYTCGIPKHEQEPFRPSWGRLTEVRLMLPMSIPWQPLSATLPQHILTCVIKNLVLSSDFLLVRVPVNRENIIYATHPLEDGPSELRNLDCLVPSPFHPPMRLKKIVSFHDDKSQVNAVKRYLVSRLPPALRNRNIIAHYHSDLSEAYLVDAYERFAVSNGTTLILIATSGAGTASKVSFNMVHT
ncbi:hypothetical protein ONZ45_g18718 [Pleurotus djamor]|nr:hypothetical protein ONZ45_g18718 [Pleurotus djamor]